MWNHDKAIKTAAENAQLWPWHKGKHESYIIYNM